MVQRNVSASFLGATLEWFDFVLYGTTAALVFNKEFFPAVDPLNGTIAALGTAVTGYLARPVGGLIFGHIGDRLGRKRTLVATMLIIGIATVSIGLLPTYHTLGTWSQVLLATLRVCQGIGLGGEYAGAALTALESAPRRQRGLIGSLPQIGNPAGSILATSAVAVCSALPGHAYQDWAWRLPFIGSSLLLAVGLSVRLRVTETVEFSAIHATVNRIRIPAATLLRTHWRALLLGLGARAADAVSGNVFYSLALVYGVQVLGLPRSLILCATAAAAVVEIAYIPMVGWVADRFGTRAIYCVGTALLGALAFPFFAALHNGSTGMVVVAVIGTLGIAAGTEFAVQSTMLAPLFPVQMRYTALSLIYQTGAVLGGAAAPVATALLAHNHHRPWPVAGLLVVVAVVSLACTLRLRRFGHMDQHQPDCGNEKVLQCGR